MRKFSVGVNHYWSKTVSGNYGGLGQQLAIELFIAIVMGIITVYCILTPNLGLFAVGFIIPTIIFVLGSLMSSYQLLSEIIENRKNKNKTDEE